jgi:hypothetical protein
MDPRTMTIRVKRRQKFKSAVHLIQSIERMKGSKRRRTATEQMEQGMHDVCFACNRAVHFEIDETTGSPVCVHCGAVQEENVIHSEVEYTDFGKAGRNFDSSGRGYQALARGAEASRSKTLRAAQTRIVGLASSMHIQNSMLCDTAYKYYETGKPFLLILCVDVREMKCGILIVHSDLLCLVVELKLIGGRTSKDIAVAVCLYMACKQDGTPHLLEDFAKAVDGNPRLLSKCVAAFQGALKKQYFAGQPPNINRAPPASGQSGV